MTLSSQDKPKQSLNSRIAYALTDRKILHFRYDAHLRQQVMKQLSKTQRELLNRLAAAGVDALPKKQLDTLLKELKQEVAKVYQEMTAYTQDELSGFFTAETQHIHQLYNDEVGFDFFNQVPEYKQKANKTATIIAGSPLADWWAKQGNDFAFKFEGIIRQGLLDGQQTSQIITDVKHLMNTSRRHAETLVITAVAKVADKAHQALRDENLDILAGEKHLSTLDTRTSTVCQLRDGLMWDLDKKPIDHDVPYQRPPLHPRCLSGDSLVLSRNLISGVSKRWFNGKMLVIESSKGFKLTCTPNHPILTGGGWVASGLLNVGDNIICDLSRDWGSIISGNDENMPSTIEQVASSFFKSRQMTTCPVPITAEDFHGDGENSQIAVIATNRLLMDNLNTTFGEQIGDEFFIFGNPQSFALTSFGSVFLFGFRLNAITSNFICSRSQLLSFFKGRSSHSCKLLFGAISWTQIEFCKYVLHRLYGQIETFSNTSDSNALLEKLCNIALSNAIFEQNNIIIQHQLFSFVANFDPLFSQNPFNNSRANIENLSGFINSFSTSVNGNHLTSWNIDFVLPNIDPIFNEQFLQPINRDVELARNICQGMFGLVGLDQIVSIKSIDFSGHVYNLDTKDGWYIANGIITHNCRSILQLVTKSWKELGIDAEEMPSSTRASQDGPVSEQINYENWLKSKSPEQQDQVLGKGKADLWRRGVITFADMLDQSGRPLTLKQLSVKLENGLLDTEQSLNQTTIELLDDLKAYNIEYRPVKMLSSQLSSDDIIAKLAGGDETKGSCASLALSYIGNRIGLDVTDYRGGKSCDFFSYKRNVRTLFSAKGVIAKEFEVLREAKGTADILNSELVLGKEYYLGAGKHAAIVRLSDSGLEYLELQSKDKNGWMSFNKYGSLIKTLNKRFGCRLNPEKHSLKRKIQLAEVDSFKSAKQDLKEVLGYLNTAEDKQKKGVLGGEK
ncbi:translation initiation factor IF-2 [[Actinobacillus] rossii]|uniref:Translation initiation factor IF-2 n=1 Tax=[Actinobacillus] rossii TaxID=123820 RepID=A0A380TX84_9PAST|nr:translation initiation factor IF-2 [[Actinobacillus] rossii]